MSAKVIAIHGSIEAGPDDGPDEDVIAFLEQTLETARSGHIRAIGMAYVNAAGGTGAAYAIGKANNHILLSAVCSLQKRVLDDLGGSD